MLGKPGLLLLLMLHVYKAARRAAGRASRAGRKWRVWLPLLHRCTGRQRVLIAPLLLLLLRRAARRQRSLLLLAGVRYLCSAGKGVLGSGCRGCRRLLGLERGRLHTLARLELHLARAVCEVVWLVLLRRWWTWVREDLGRGGRRRGLSLQPLLSVPTG